MLKLVGQTVRRRLFRSLGGRARGVALIALLSLGAAACGGGSSKSSTTTSKSTATASTSAAATTAPTRGGGTSSVSTGPVRGTLQAENHTPKVGQEWSYSVTATDAGGHPLPGTVNTQFVFGGQVVGRESPPTHRLTNGHLQDTLEFPAQAVGVPLTVQTVIHTNLGSITLDWPVKVVH